MTFHEIVFSPTGGTQKAADILTRRLCASPHPIDLSDSSLTFAECFIHSEDVSIIAVPSFAGRTPKTAIDRILQLRGNGSRAVLMVVYGNREYDDTLIELQDACVQAGFRPIAAVTAIAEHSVVRSIAAGRPDADDVQELESFADAIRQRLSDKTYALTEVPGHRPYKQTAKSVLIPQAGESCILCGLCAQHCPVGAIDFKHPNATDADVCISCLRCLSVCPVGARALNPDALDAITQKLTAMCKTRKDNALI